MAYMDSLKQFFNEAGWLANALGIGLPAGGFILAVVAAVRRWVWKPSMEQFLTTDQRRKWTQDKVKKIMRIAIVDDQPIDFPTAELKRDGFGIQVFKQVQLVDIAPLAAFDIVFLDMKGVVKDDPEYGGLKLIGELRQRNPIQKICAVSSKTFDPTATEFFRKADEVKRKPMTAQECKAVIDNFSHSLFDVDIVRDQGHAILQELSSRIRYKLVADMKVAVKSASDASKLNGKLSQLGLTESQKAPFITVCRILHAP